MGSAEQQQRGMYLTADDYSVARQVEELHYPDVANKFDIKPLFRLVQDIIERATLDVAGESVGLSNKNKNKAMHQGTISKSASFEEKYNLSNLQQVPKLPCIVKRITCEMTCKVRSGADAHNTTLAVLGILQHFSWEAKVVLTLAAFTLEYQHVWILVQINKYSTNAIGKAIKRFPMVVEEEGAFNAINNLLKAMLEITKCIVEFGELPTMYISTEDRDVKAAMNHFPITVYWIIISVVAAATYVTTMSSRRLEYHSFTSKPWELSKWAQKLKEVSQHLRQRLSELYQLIGDKKDIDDINMIRNIIYNTSHIDNIDVLHVFISAKHDVPPLYDGINKNRVHLDILRKRHVLLLISDLDITSDELVKLEQSYTELKVHSCDIVWIPVIDDLIGWTNDKHAKFEKLKTSMCWYSVDHLSMIENKVVKFINKEWHFKGRPIIVVLDPLGKVVSANAIHMMWIWQSNAFPFTSAREEALWAEETWRLDLLVNGIDTKILEWIRQEKYIFVFGGDDLEWIRRFTRETHAVARALRVSVEMAYVGKSHSKELVRRVTKAIMTEQLSHCWEDPTFVWYFWTRIECMIYSNKHLGRVHDQGNEILQEIQRLKNHDISDSGWAILAKGSKIIVNGHGKVALYTLEELKLWKEVAEREGLDEGFRLHYHLLQRYQ